MNNINENDMFAAVPQAHFQNAEVAIVAEELEDEEIDLILQEVAEEFAVEDRIRLLEETINLTNLLSDIIEQNIANIDEILEQIEVINIMEDLIVEEPILTAIAALIETRIVVEGIINHIPINIDTLRPALIEVKLAAIQIIAEIDAIPNNHL